VRGPSRRRPRGVPARGVRLLRLVSATVIAAALLPTGVVTPSIDLAAEHTAGSLDLTFDGDGIALTELASSVDADDAAEIQSGPHAGKLFVLADERVWRLLADGSLDTTFGPNGEGVVEPGFDGLVEHIALRPDGSGFVLSITDAGSGCSSDRLVARFDIDGVIDAAYGDAGRACFDWTAFSTSDVIVQDDDRVVALGLLLVPGPPDTRQIALARVAADGQSTDTTVALDPATEDVQSNNALGKELAVQSNGRIVALATAFPLFDFPDDPVGITVARFLPDDLSLDTSFAPDGDGIINAETPGFDGRFDGIGLALAPRQSPAGPATAQIGVTVRSTGAAPFTVRLLRFAAEFIPPPPGVEFGTPAGSPLGSPIDVVFDDPNVQDATIGDLTSSDSGFAGLVEVGYTVDGPADHLAVIPYDLGDVGATPQVTTVAHPAGDLDVGLFFLSDPVSLLLHRADGSLMQVGRLIDAATFDRMLAVTRLLEDTGGATLQIVVDDSFGDGGFVIHGGNTLDQGRAVTVQPDHQILVGGRSRFGGYVFRHDEAGPLDIGFGGPTAGTSARPGVTFMPFDVYGVAADPTDQAVVVVGADEGDSSVGAVQRLLPDGSPDPDFNGGEYLRASFPTDPFGDGLLGSFEELFRDVAVQPDGRIVAVGDGEGEVCDASSCTTQRSVIVARFLTSGELDPSFGDDVDGNGTRDGFTTIGPIPGSAMELALGNGVAVQSDGRIVVTGALVPPPPAGTIAPLTPQSMALVARLLPDGSRDATFAGEVDEGFGEGMLLDSVSGTDDFGLPHAGAVGDAVTVHDDGRITVAGRVLACQDVGGECGFVDRLVALQVLPSGARDTAFADNGAFVWGPAVDVPADGAGIGLDATGTPLLTGAAGSDVVVLRLLQSGILDATFGTDGVVVTDLAGGSRADDLAVAPDGKIVVAGGHDDDRGVRVMTARYNPGVATLACVPEPLDLGGVDVGDSTTAGVICTATGGTVDVTGLTVDPTSDHPDDFTVEPGNCDGPLLPDTACDFSVTFTPPTDGDRRATVQVAHTTATGPAVLAVSVQGRGTGDPGFAATPNPLVFDDQLIGTISPSGTVTVTNVGNLPMTISATSLDGASPDDYALIADSCEGTTLPAGGSCTVGVLYTPAPGPAVNRPAQLRFVDTAPGSPHAVELRGAIVPATLDLDPDEGPIGTEVEATGTGFAPGAVVRLSIAGAVVGTVPGAEVSTDGFVATFVVPEGTPGGPQDVVACQNCDSAAIVEASAPFVVTPRMFVTPSLSRPGGIVTAEGDGFPANTPVTLRWQPGLGTRVVVTDAFGQFMTPVLVFRRDILGARELQASISASVEVVATAPLLAVPGSSQPRDFASRR